MGKGKILLCDDEEHFREKCLATLKSQKNVTKNFEIASLESYEFVEDMEVLKERQRSYRDGEYLEQSPSKLDDVSILIVDYDLLNLLSKESFLTGENVAYEVRCFSKCDMIIVMNQYRYGDDIFDLTLKGHPESFADLNISSEQLGNPGLWGGQTRGFRPWQWPHLPTVLENFRQRVEDVATNLDTPILEVLGIPEEIAGMLPRSAIEFIGDDLPKTTFKEFLRRSEKGLARKDKKMVEVADPETLGRIAAARISKWLERIVLPGQDILIDAPHLVSRYPSLLTGKHANIGSWNKATKFESYDALGLDHEMIEEYRFKKEHWLSRPAWFWNGVSDCQRIKEVSDPWTREKTDYVFCEDSSRFHKASEAEEFLAELESPYLRRYVRIFENINYEPKTRLSL